MVIKTTKHEAAVDAAQWVTDRCETIPEEWRGHLEIIGAELFQRYRKRLMSPGVVREMRRDYPGLSLPDVLLRVHAGQRLIEQGRDFQALAAIRGGDWQRYLDSQAEAARRRGDPVGQGDRISRWLVKGGGVLFGGFCLLSLAPALSPGAVILVPLLLTVTIGVGLFGRRRLRRGPWGRSAGGAGGGHDPMPSL